MNDFHSLSPGITDVRRNCAFLQTPTDERPGEYWRYGLGFPFQVSPTEAAIFANIHVVSADIWDYENGTDLIVFDDPRQIDASGAIAVSRNHREIDPSSGQTVEMVKYPFHGGFIPLGAKRGDGSPHPHSGTGFGMCVVLAHGANDKFGYLEMRQLLHNGKSFQVGEPQRVDFTDVVDGFKIINLGLGSAIADGDDLLFPMVMEASPANRNDYPQGGMTATLGCVSGLARWRSLDTGWRPISFVPVTGKTPALEPSIVRDVDGSLLFTARTGGDHSASVVVWRSRDNGASWDKVLDVPNLRQPSCISIGRAADGTPYIVCNQSFKGFINCLGHLGAEGYITFREVLCVWPFTADRTSLMTPFFARIPRYEYGPPTDGNEWYVDHPVGAAVRLADGKWRHLLCCRIMAIAEGLGKGYPPTPHSGLHVSEIVSSGMAQPVWNF